MSDSEDEGIGFFNPDLFTSHIGYEDESLSFGNGAMTVKMKFVHGSNQFLEKFVSRVIWPSAEAMCDKFALAPDLVKGKRVLELGSGTGLLGILMARLGAAKVVMTDYNDEAIELINENVEKNEVSDLCECFRFTWGDDEGAKEILAKSLAPGQLFDIVIGTDVIYEPECIDPFLRSVKAFIEPNNGMFYLTNHVARFLKYEEQVRALAQTYCFKEICPSETIKGPDGSVEALTLQLLQTTNLDPSAT